MHISELETFIIKFKQLWFCGLDAHLDVNPQAGQAWVGLHLGEAPPGPPHFHPHQEKEKRRQVGPSQQRRHKCREAERQAVAMVARHETANCDAEEVDQTVVVAEEAKSDNEVTAIADTTEAVKATTENAKFSCELCDSNLKNLRGINVHEGRAQKANGGSPIPQLDGQHENVTDGKIYTFVSDFAFEDIELTLKEIFSEDGTEFISRVKIGGQRSADPYYTVRIKLSYDDQRFSVF